MPIATATETPTQPPFKVWTIGRILQLIFFLLLLFGGLFFAAGTMRWLRGWMYTFGILAAYVAATALVMRKNPALVPARAKWRFREMRPFDRAFMAMFFPLYLAQPIVAGLDAVRYQWSSMPFWTVYVGLILTVCGMGLVTWAMVVNRFAEPVVRIQKERQQRTVTTGPYRYVRHPMYTGVVLMFPATGLILGSWWAMAIGCAMGALFIWRAAMEDRFLQRELPGYREFAATTRYRLVPGVW